MCFTGVSANCSRKTEVKMSQSSGEMTEYFRMHADVGEGRKREYSKSREGGIQQDMNLRPDLYRTGMCPLERFLAESNRILD